MTDTSTQEQPHESDANKPLTTRKAPKIGKSFTSRNPLPIGIIGLVFLLVLLIAAFNASKLPLIGGGTQYTAYFTEDASLKPDDDVRIAGVKAGQVQSVSLDSSKGLVKAVFTIKDGWVGNQSTIDLKLKTLLGDKYLSINSRGTKAQNASDAIPVSRTTSPFDVYPAFSALSRTVENINTTTLAQSFRTLAQDFSGTPKSVRPVVDGLSRLSTTIASRNAKLQTLLSAANKVTGTLAARDQDLTRLLSDGNLLLAELNSRRDAIHSLLINTSTLSAQLRGLVADNEKTLGPLLDRLDSLLTVLQDNQDSLDRGLALLGPFYRVFNNVIGNGHWFDNYVQNLSPTGVLGLLGVGSN
ncbi:MCE family protein [uncultured Jatrophihabitans sp.]|uniref:MCE family protein n=1 Tax=uncultured Jatrophihabitans sp. TaxID=1610747 RepID=UPI0035CC808D